ncbi:MAG: polysaccharide deacetylase family protein [Verrucomicrobiota bacterium]
MNARKFKEICATLAGKVSSRLHAGSGERRVILCFHSVHPTAKHSSIRPEAFERIMRWLAENVELMDVVSLINGTGNPTSKPAVALTFDDGHRDNLTHALPIARDHGASFCTYVMTGLLEGDSRVRERFRAQLRLKSEDFEALTWDDAEAMVEQGCSIGSHTWDHPMLSHLPPDGIEFQLAISKDLLEKRLGLKRIGMCYPYGKIGRNVNETAIRTAERLGYDYGLCVEHRGLRPREDRFAIPRFIIIDDNLEKLRRQISGEEDYHGFVSRHMPEFLAKKLSRADYHEADDALPPVSGHPLWSKAGFDVPNCIQP